MKISVDEKQFLLHFPHEFISHPTVADPMGEMCYCGTYDYSDVHRGDQMHIDSILFALRAPEVLNATY
jgi:hypothetical protein